MIGISPDIETLIGKVSRLPGLGPRSARRIVLHLLKNKDKLLEPLITALSTVQDQVKECPICGNLDIFEQTCHICSDPLRSVSLLCIVESVSDIWAVERSKCFNGKYHVLHHLLSSINGNGPESLMLDKLLLRCERDEITEVVFALSATLDGQTTDQYIRSYISSSKPDIKLTSLAVGIPMGGELDFLDDGTLFTAFNFRK